MVIILKCGKASKPNIRASCWPEGTLPWNSEDFHFKSSGIRTRQTWRGSLQGLQQQLTWSTQVTVTCVTVSINVGHQTLTNIQIFRLNHLKDVRAERTTRRFCCFHFSTYTFQNKRITFLSSSKILICCSRYPGIPWFRVKNICFSSGRRDDTYRGGDRKCPSSFLLYRLYLLILFTKLLWTLTFFSYLWVTRDLKSQRK